MGTAVKNVKRDGAGMGMAGSRILEGASSRIPLRRKATDRAGRGCTSGFWADGLGRKGRKRCSGRPEACLEKNGSHGDADAVGPTTLSTSADRQTIAAFQA